MDKQLRIAGYCRISVDDELNKDNTSIDNQKSIITDYAKRMFPDAQLDIYVDRDRSGYTFEQREGYQALRKKMFRKEYDILLVKDFSRFSRRTSRGLVELEDLKDVGLRIISIGDGIDYPTSDDWTAIQFRFLINEMPVTDTSKKIRAVIKRRQEEGKWICRVPYGYVMTNPKKMMFTIDEPSATIVRQIFELYANGWGYKRIANYLTDNHIPTPRKTEELRKEANGDEFIPRAKQSWSIVSVSNILANDFYIGTLRQRKYSRKHINGGDVKLQEAEHIVIANHHPPIIDFKLFSVVQEQLKLRSTSHYRGIKKYNNVYTGHLFCGDCGSHMLSLSKPNLAAAYHCGAYHHRGLKACTSHHIRCDMLDKLLKEFIQKVKENSEAMLQQLQKSIDREQKETSFNKNIIETLLQRIEETKNEIKLLNRQRIYDMQKHPEQEEMLSEIYDEQIGDLTIRIEGLQAQIQIETDRHNTIANINRTARTVIDVFDTIIQKQSLTKLDIDFILDRIYVYQDHIDIHLKSDIDKLLHTGIPKELQEQQEQQEEFSGNFNLDTKKSKNFVRFTTIRNNKGEILSVNVVYNGSPSLTTLTQDYQFYSAFQDIAERLHIQP